MILKDLIERDSDLLTATHSAPVKPDDLSIRTETQRHPGCIASIPGIDHATVELNECVMIFWTIDE